MSALTADARAAIKVARDEARRAALGLVDGSEGRRTRLDGDGRQGRASPAVVGLLTSGGVPERALLHAVIVFEERKRLKVSRTPL